MNDNIDVNDIIHGPPKTTNKRDANGNLLDAQGNQIEWDNTNSWATFAKSLLHYFFLSLLIGLFGSGFVYMTSRGSDLDNILPVDGDFYSPNPIPVTTKGPSIDVNCVEISTGTTIKITDNFPYYLKEDDDLDEFLNKDKDPETGKGGPGLGRRFKRWFARAVMGSFMMNRGILKAWYGFFEPNTPLGNHAFQICLVFPFTMMLGQFAPLCTGFVCSVISSLGADPLIGGLGIILVWTWLVVVLMTIIIYLRFLMTLLFLPLVLDWKEVANIMSCNAKTIAILFGFFACGAAYDNLDSTISGMMGIVFLFYVTRTIYKYFTGEVKAI